MHVAHFLTRHAVCAHNKTPTVRTLPGFHDCACPQVDCMMPGMSGHEFCQQLRQSIPSTVLPVIMVCCVCASRVI